MISSHVVVEKLITYHTNRERVHKAERLKCKLLVGSTLMYVNYGRVEWWKYLTVDMILGKNHVNHLITTIDLGVLKV